MPMKIKVCAKCVLASSKPLSILKRRGWKEDQHHSLCGAIETTYHIFSFAPWEGLYGASWKTLVSGMVSPTPLQISYTFGWLSLVFTRHLAYSFLQDLLGRCGELGTKWQSRKNSLIVPLMSCCMVFSFCINERYYLRTGDTTMPACPSFLTIVCSGDRCGQVLEFWFSHFLC